MKITLVQAEIEEAITQYVNSTLTLAPGTSVSIDLFSPRGSTDINASIDLMTVNEKKIADAKAAAAPAQVTAPAKKEEAPAAEPSAETPAPAAEADPVATATGADTQAASGTETSDAPPAGEKKSLFGNLARPNNA